MLEKLLTSKTRVQILSLFFDNEDKKYYTQEIIKLTKTDPSNAFRELLKLKAMGILKDEARANQKYYYLDKDLEYYEPLKKLFEIYNKKQGGDKWINLEEMPEYFFPMMASAPWCVKNANKFFSQLRLKNRFSQLMVTYNNDVGCLLALKNEFEALSKEIVDTFIHQPEIAEKYYQLIKTQIPLIEAVTEKLFKTNMTAFTPRELEKYFREFYSIYEPYHNLHWLQTCADFGDNLFSKYLMNYLKTEIKNQPYSVGDVFSTLSAPTDESLATKEYKALLLLIEEIYKNSGLKSFIQKTENRIILDQLRYLYPDFDKKLEEHIKNFGWLGYNFRGPGWNKSYFIDIIGSLVRQNTKPAKLLADLERNKKDLVQKQGKFISELKIDPAHQRLFKIARQLVYSKGLRKDHLFYYMSAQENFFKELARRYYLTVKQCLFFYPQEISALLLANKLDAAKLNERIKFSLHYSTGYYTTDKILEGDKAKKFLAGIQILKEDIADTKILFGDCASSGRVRGEVVIINTQKDMAKMKEGQILVSIATTPDLISAIKKAGAIVTDAGGITCHAAIISRELGIPCVIGTKIATKILKDGDVVDVDAVHGKVMIIEKINK